MFSFSIYRKRHQSLGFVQVLQPCSRAQGPHGSFGYLVLHQVLFQLDGPFRDLFGMNPLLHQGCVRAFCPLAPLS